MTAVLPNQLLTAEVIDTTNRVAALEHLPAAEARDLVSAAAPVAVAAKLRTIAHSARLTMHVRGGCCRVVRSDDLLRIADGLLDDAEDIVAGLRERHVDDEPNDPDVRVEQLEHELDLTRRELALVRAMHGAVIDECVGRAKTQRLNWGEHPATLDDLAKVEHDARAYWDRVALEGCQPSAVDVITPAGVA